MCIHCGPAAATKTDIAADKCCYKTLNGSVIPLKPHKRRLEHHRRNTRRYGGNNGRTGLRPEGIGGEVVSWKMLQLKQKRQC